VAECSLAETLSTGYARAGSLVSLYSERESVNSLRSPPKHLHFGPAFMSDTPIKTYKLAGSLSCSLALSQDVGTASYKILDQGAPLPPIQHERSFGSPQHPTVLHTVAPYRNVFRSLESKVSLVECRG